VFPSLGAVLLVVLGAGLLIRVTDRAEVPPKTPDSPPVEVRAVESQPITETVDLRNGNVHLQIPILSTHWKPTAPRSEPLSRVPAAGVPGGQGEQSVSGRSRHALVSGVL